jgi:hypothetical protein
MLVNRKYVKKNELENAVSDMVKNFFPNEGYKVNFFGYRAGEAVEYHLVHVSEFSDYQGAMMFVGSVEQDENLRNWFDNSEEQVFFITAGNFRTAYSQKRLEDYAKYYIYHKDDWLGFSK